MGYTVNQLLAKFPRTPGYTCGPSWIPHSDVILLVTSLGTRVHLWNSPILHGFSGYQGTYMAGPQYFGLLLTLPGNQGTLVDSPGPTQWLQQLREVWVQTWNFFLSPQWSQLPGDASWEPEYTHGSSFWVHCVLNLLVMSPRNQAQWTKRS